MTNQIEHGKDQKQNASRSASEKKRCLLPRDQNTLTVFFGEAVFMSLS